MSCFDVKKTIAQYIYSCEVEVGLRPKTIEGKRETLSRLTKFLDGSELSQETFRGFISHLRELEWKPSSIVSEGKVIKAFIGWLFKQDVIPSNWGTKVVLPKLRKEEMEIVPFETALQIIEAGCEFLESDNKLVKQQRTEAREALTFILKSGLRNAELRSLKAEDFNLEEKTFSLIRKGGGKAMLPIAGNLIDLLKPRVKRGGLMFIVGEKMLQNSMAKGCKKMEVTKHIRVHSLRHIFATTLLKDKTPYGQTRRLMGHSDTRILDTVYAHYDVNDLALSLNSSRIVPQGITPKEKLERILNLVKNEVGGDERFIFSYKSDQSTLLSFNIRLSELH